MVYLNQGSAIVLSRPDSIQKRKVVKHTNKYLGTYRIFAPVNLSAGKTTENLDDTYLKGKYRSETYRQNENTLAIYFPAANSSTKIVLPLFNDLGIDYKLHIEGDYEAIYTFPEKDIHKVNRVLKFQTKGKDIKPTSVRTARRLT